VEVVVGGVAASVSLGANGCACGVVVSIHGSISSESCQRM
jgi:hypothetical protein